MTTADLAIYAGVGVLAYAIQGPLAAGGALILAGVVFAALDAFV